MKSYQLHFHFICNMCTCICGFGIGKDLKCLSCFSIYINVTVMCRCPFIVKIIQSQWLYTIYRGGIIYILVPGVLNCSILEHDFLFFFFFDFSTMFSVMTIERCASISILSCTWVDNNKLPSSSIYWSFAKLSQPRICIN